MLLNGFSYFRTWQYVHQCKTWVEAQGIRKTRVNDCIENWNRNADDEDRRQGSNGTEVFTRQENTIRADNSCRPVTHTFYTIWTWEIQYPVNHG